MSTSVSAPLCVLFENLRFIIVIVIIVITSIIIIIIIIIITFSITTAAIQRMFVHSVSNCACVSIYVFVGL